MLLAALTLCTKHAVRMYTPWHTPSYARRVVKSLLSALSLDHRSCSECAQRTRFGTRAQRVSAA